MQWKLGQMKGLRGKILRRTFTARTFTWRKRHDSCIQRGIEIKTCSWGIPSTQISRARILPRLYRGRTTLDERQDFGRCVSWKRRLMSLLTSSAFWKWSRTKVAKNIKIFKSDHGGRIHVQRIAGLFPRPNNPAIGYRLVISWYSMVEFSCYPYSIYIFS